MTLIEDFFFNSPPCSSLLEEEYKKIDLLVKAFATMAKGTYQSIYIIDYYKKKFLYVADNSLFLCGHTSEEVKELGYRFYTNHIPLAEQNIVLEINKSILDFFYKVPLGEQIDYTIFYDFHITKGQKEVLINHKLTPL